MESLFNNPEFKSITIKLVILQLIFTVVCFLFIKINFEKFNTKMVNQNIALTGNLLLKHPELENDIIKDITKTPSENEINKGRDILKQYGYTSEMEIYSQPMLNKFYYNFQIKNIILMGLYFIPLFILIKKGYEIIYRKIKEISYASERVVKGDFNFTLSEGNEGQFGILGNQFNDMANRLKLTLEKLKEEKIFLKNIISDISHQLKTPLSALIMFNELLIEDKNMDNHVRDEFLEKSKLQLDRMEWLIINLLKMARVEAGVINFENKKISLTKAVKLSLIPLNFKAKEKKQNIEINEESKDVFFNGDLEWTAEALTNIIKNCIEHTNENGKITICISKTPIFSRIIIKDNGEGINKKDIPHIFERFYKGSNSVKVQSVGIGLALSKVIIESQNGSISVKSKKGVGTEFTITFLKGVI